MVRITAILLLLFNGLSALSGGYGMISNPSGKRLQLPLEWLQYSPFQDYLIPGVILFVVLGLGSLAAAVTAIRRAPHYSRWIIGMGVVTIGWIVVQILLLQMLHWLHYVYGGVGWALLLLGMVERKILRADPDLGEEEAA